MNEIATIGISWTPIEAAGDNRKDGRDVLIWAGAGYPVVCSWCDGWRDPVGREVEGATHLADIGGPGGARCLGR